MDRTMGTLSAALTRFINLRSASVAPTTQKYHREILKTLQDEFPGIQQPPHSITEDAVAEFAMRVGHFSESRWNAMVGLLKRFIPIATSNLRRRRIIPKRKPPPSPAEFAALLAECERLSRSKAGLVISFLAHTGLRIAAARKLKWPDVYEDRIEYIAKGGRTCSVPIINGLRDTLSRLRDIDDGSGHVLPRAGIRGGLEKACKQAGIRKLSHHDFRHMFTTRCIESGVDLPTVARWRGDSDGGAMLSKYYFHLLDEHSRKAAARVVITWTLFCGEIAGLALACL